jgi:hypothetical protein
MVIASREADPATVPLTGPRASRAARTVFALPTLVPVAVAGFAVGPMLLLLAGHFLPWLAIAVGLVGAAGALAACRLPSEPVSRAALLWTLAAVALALVWLVTNYLVSAQNLYAQRDPATYGLTARWLMDHPSLVIPTHPEVFGSLPGTDDTSAGFLDQFPGQVYAQGNHLLPVLLALAGTVFGAGIVLWGNVVVTALALLAFFGTARRIVGAPLALVAMAALAVSMPILNVGRDTYSEPLALLLLIGGLGLVQRAIDSGRTIDFALAGFVSGGSALARIDSYASLLALIVVALVLAAAAAPSERGAAVRRSAALLVGGLPMAALGWLDLTRLAGGYYHNQRVQIFPLMLTAAALLVLGAVAVGAVWRYDVARRLGAARHRVANLGCVLVLLGFAGLLSRPLWLKTRASTDIELIRVLQQAAGDAIDGTRLYAEQTVDWQAMYLGWVTVGLAVIGYLLLLRALVIRGEWGLLAVLTTGLSVSALYLWTPQITPDQIWAMRRFVPVVMPVMLIAAMYTLRRARARLRGGGGRVLVAVGAVVVVAVPATVSYPVRGLREQAPQRAQVAAICRAVGDRGAVLAIDDGLRYGYSQTIRSWCGVPAVGLVGATVDELAAARRSAVAAGRTLYVIATTPAQGRYPAGPPSAPFSSTTVTMWPQTLHRPPQRARTQTITVYLATVQPDGRLVAVPRR